VRHRFLKVSLAAFVLAACGDVTSPTDELTAARKRWEAWGVASYDLVVQRGPCFCPIEAMDKIVVAVRGGSITRYHFDDGAPVVSVSHEFPAVPGLFDLIATAIANGSVVEVDYDPSTGTPLHIVIDRQDMPVDGGSELYIMLRDPQPIPDI
jgi:hypothetical protein